MMSKVNFVLILLLGVAVFLFIAEQRAFNDGMIGLIKTMNNTISSSLKAAQAQAEVSGKIIESIKLFHN